jgi:hypothetical protein
MMKKKKPCKSLIYRTFLKGARTDSNRRHSEPQSELEIHRHPQYLEGVALITKNDFALILRRLMLSLIISMNSRSFS